MNSQHREVISENALLVLSIAFLHLDFVDDCGNGLSSHIEQLIHCLTIILQVTGNVNYANEIIHMLAYLKRLWKRVRL